jgi:enoyl-CoA hydratase
VSSPVAYDLSDGIACVTLDDGKANALSAEVSKAVAAAFARAREEEARAVVLAGRERTFSAGFDVRCPPEGWPDMVASGAELAEGVMTFPRPVVAACNGNAIAMGAFLLLACDHRIGARGDFKIGLNEVAIGLTIPWFGIELARHRLTRPYFDRCTITGTFLAPDEARQAGFLDELVKPEAVLSAALASARALTALDPAAHAATKLRTRERAIAGVRAGAERIRSGAPEW